MFVYLESPEAKTFRVPAAIMSQGVVARSNHHRFQTENERRWRVKTTHGRHWQAGANTSGAGYKCLRARTRFASIRLESTA